MTTFSTLLRKELVEQWRTMRMPTFLVVFFFVGIASPASAKYLPRLMETLGGASLAAALPTPTAGDAYAQLAKNVTQLGALVVVVVSMAVVSSERERGTLAFLLSKPVARASFLAAKLAALATTIALGMVVAAATAYAYTTLLFSAPGPGFVALCAAALLSLLVLATVTLAGSTITGSAVAAGGIGLVALVLFGVVSMLPTIGPYTPAGVVGRAIEVASGTDAGALAGPLLAQVGIVVVAFGLALLALRGQEI